MGFLEENANVIVVVLVALVLLYLFMNRTPESYQDDIGIDGRGMTGRGPHISQYWTGCTPP